LRIAAHYRFGIPLHLPTNWTVSDDDEDTDR
jgi:hypothetical protein